MQERNVPFFHKVGKPLRVVENRERVLARERQRNVFAAGLFDLCCQSSPFARDQCGRSRARQRFGDLDGRLLAASGVETRHDLQNGYL